MVEWPLRGMRKQENKYACEIFISSFKERATVFVCLCVATVVEGKKTERSVVNVSILILAFMRLSVFIGKLGKTWFHSLLLRRKMLRFKYKSKRVEHLLKCLASAGKK